jgi:hypothetical protein
LTDTENTGIIAATETREAEMETIINNWSTTAPFNRQLLQGDILNHSKKGDIKNALTTEVIGKRGEKVVTKSGTEYTLGEIDPLYEQHFPNAKQRLLNTLLEIEA